MKKESFDRVVIGGGLFGTFSALLLGKAGHKVLLIEKDNELMSRASFVNQARLHTGLHYPRSLVTARESLKYYDSFRKKFPSAVFDFKQIYAIASQNSKTSGSDFSNFINRLGTEAREVHPGQYFNDGTVDLAVSVEEPTFDARILRNLLRDELDNSNNIEIKLSAEVVSGELRDLGSILVLDNGNEVLTDGVVIAAYAGTNSIRKKLGLELLPLSFELTEVLLGKVSHEYQSIGFTVMDGPFWSLMPFGNTNQVSLTSVGITPIFNSKDLPLFPCQMKRSDCSPSSLANCNSCRVRPKSGQLHQVQQMKKFMKNHEFFTPTNSLMTVKSVLSSTVVDDARPTMIHLEQNSKTWTVFSGKVSTLFDLEGVLN